MDMYKSDAPFIWYYRMVFSFFTEERMRNMKHLPMYGYQFVVIFLELCGIATPTKGYITIDGYAPGEIAPVLCKDIGEDAEITLLALKYFDKQGLIEVWAENNATIIHIPFLRDKIGKRSRESEGRYQRRLKAKEKEREFLALKEGLDERLAECSAYGVFKNVFLTNWEKNELEQIYSNADEIIKRVGIEKKGLGVEAEGEVETDYDRCLKKGNQIGKEK